MSRVRRDMSRSRLPLPARPVRTTAVVGALPFPEERWPVARVVERLRFRRQVPERRLRVAEVEADQPGLLGAEAGCRVEQAVLERELEAPAPAVACADDEIHRVLFR